MTRIEQVIQFNREHPEMTVRQVAEALGMGPDHVSRIGYDKRLTFTPAARGKPKSVTPRRPYKGARSLSAALSRMILMAAIAADDPSQRPKPKMPPITFPYRTLRGEMTWGRV